MKPFEKPVFAKYGAPMGRSPYEVPEGKVRLERVTFYDGDYDKGGAYWGGGSPLYCAWNDSGSLYVRASTRESAKARLLSDHPDLKFFR